MVLNVAIFGRWDFRQRYRNRSPWSKGKICGARFGRSITRAEAVWFSSKNSWLFNFAGRVGLGMKSFTAGRNNWHRSEATWWPGCPWRRRSEARPRESLRVTDLSTRRRIAGWGEPSHPCLGLPESESALAVNLKLSWVARPPAGVSPSPSLVFEEAQLVSTESLSPQARGLVSGCPSQPGPCFRSPQSAWAGPFQARVSAAATGVTTRSMFPKQNRWWYPTWTPARTQVYSRHGFHRIDLLSQDLGGGLHSPLSSRTARLTKVRPAQAVTSHRPISKSWKGSRQATGPRSEAESGAAATRVLDDGERAPPGGSAEAGRRGGSHGVAR